MKNVKRYASAKEGWEKRLKQPVDERAKGRRRGKGEKPGAGEMKESSRQPSKTER